MAHCSGNILLFGCGIKTEPDGWWTNSERRMLVLVSRGMHQGIRANVLSIVNTQSEYFIIIYIFPIFKKYEDIHTAADPKGGGRRLGLPLTSPVKTMQLRLPLCGGHKLWICYSHNMSHMGIKYLE